MVFAAIWTCILFEEAAQEIKWCQTHAATHVDADRNMGEGGGHIHIQCALSQFLEMEGMEGAKEATDFNSMASQPCPQQHLLIHLDKSFKWIRFVRHRIFVTFHNFHEN